MSEYIDGASNMKIDRKLFIPATDEEKASIEVMRPTTTYWQDAWRRLKKNRTALVSLILIIILIIASILIPLISPYGFEQIIKTDVQQTPSLNHPFGTDNLGRDILVRCMIGTRISLIIGFISAFFVTVIGITFGAISGYFGGWVDTVMMRFVDIVYSIPTTLVAIILQVVLDEPMDKWFTNNPKMGALQDLGGVFSIIIVLILLYWVDMSRIVRGQVLSLKQQEYILAAKTLGSPSKRIIFKHLIPNCMGEIIVTATLKIPQAIFFEAFLSFIGIGVKPPMASLGSLVNSGIKSIYTYPLDLIFPALLISLIILAFNLLGDGLRDALDPRLKQ
jgi:oligopeptide transport system permease protein